MRRMLPTGLYVIDMGLLIWAVKNLSQGGGALLLVGWLIFTPLAVWGMRRIDRAGWDEWLRRTGSTDDGWWW
jgi:hypothetical protein